MGNVDVTLNSVSWGKEAVPKALAVPITGSEGTEAVRGVTDPQVIYVWTPSLPGES